MRSVLVVSAALLLLATHARAQTPPVASAIAAHVRAGADDAALATIATLPSAERATGAVRYLEGRLLERASRFAEAASAFEAARELPSSVARDAAVRRGRALLYSGDAAAAETVLAAITPSDASVRALIAEAALARGDAERAEALLQAVIAEAGRDVDTFAARMQLAEAALGADDRALALRTLHWLVVQRPEHPDADAAADALAAIDGPVTLTVAEHLERAERLATAHRASDAASELERIEPDAASRARYLHVRGMALFDAHRYPDAQPLLERAAAIEDSETRVADAFHAARSLLRQGQAAEARTAFRAFVRAHGDDDLAVEAEYLTARSELEAGGAHASRAMQRFVDGARGRRATEFGLEAAFTLALLAIDRHDTTDAVRRLEAYRARVSAALDRGRAEYWRARALEVGDRHSTAFDAYRALVAGEPLSWYAVLARRRLIAAGEPDPAPLALTEAPDETTPSIALPEAAAFYLGLGLDRDAADALASSEASVRRTEGPRAVSTAYLSLFDFHDAYRVVGLSPLLARPPTAGAAWAWDAAYPRAFEPAVTEAAQITRIGPELIWAVMRQESAFDPEVVSYADAIGLMQLMPATAAVVARRTGTSYARNVLFDATTNVRLGAAYLSELDRRYGVPLCFSAYNAGEHRVEEWLARGETDLDRFVEQIPFTQTRNYTRRVTASLAHYRFRAAPDAGWPDLGLPDQVGH
jgi:soluble lytic murein transglycosylase